MENLQVDPTHSTPKINFRTTGLLEISGSSYPEDSYEYYDPILDWFNSYSQKPADLTELHFKMEYFNTSSSVFILKLIKGAAKLQIAGNKVSINWHHQADDDEMQEAGKDFSILAKTTVHLIPY